MNDTHGQQGEGWYGFDLDGTLAKYDKWRGLDHIGDPVKPMVELIKEMHAEGKKVKILTARVAPRMIGDTHAPGCKCGHCEEAAAKGPYLQEQYLAMLDDDGNTRKRTASEFIADWCRKHLGFVPEIVYQKDQLMISLYDDRVKQVVPNEGWLVEDIAMSKRRHVETTIVKREIVNCKWFDRMNAFLIGLMVGCALFVAVVMATGRSMPEAERKLREAAEGYSSAFQKSVVEEALHIGK